MENDRGLIIIHTGPGKGKTTAAFGLCMRVIGRGYKSVVLQFLKGKDGSGEVLACAKYCPDMIDVYTYGRKGFIGRQPRDKDYKMAEEALYKIRDIYKEHQVKLIVLDEINVALSWNLLSFEKVEEVLKERPRDKHIVLTGRKAPDRLNKIADTVTIFEEAKHHFDLGFGAVEGIEY